MKKLFAFIVLIPLFFIQYTDKKGLDIKSGLPNSPDMINPLKIGDKILHFVFKDYKGSDFDLTNSEY